MFNGNNHGITGCYGSLHCQWWYMSADIWKGLVMDRISKTRVLEVQWRIGFKATWTRVSLIFANKEKTCSTYLKPNFAANFRYVLLTDPSLSKGLEFWIRPRYLIPNVQLWNVQLFRRIFISSWFTSQIWCQWCFSYRYSKFDGWV